MSGLQILSINFDELVSDPPSPEEGQMWHNTTENAWKGHVGGVTKVFAILDPTTSDADIVQVIDASEGLEGPSGWRVTPAGVFYPVVSGYDIGLPANRVGRLFTDEARVYIDGVSDLQLISNSIRRVDGSGQHLLGNNANNPQLLLGDPASSGYGNIDMNNGRSLYLNALQDGDVIVGAGDLYSEDAGVNCGRRTYPWDEVHGAHMWFVTSVKVGAYTAAKGEIVRVDTSGGDVTITLPSSGGVEGAAVYIWKVSSDTNKVIVDTTGADVVDGSSSVNIIKSDGSAYFVADGSTSWNSLKAVDGVDNAPAVFVLRPGGVAGGNVYTTWATLYSALSGVEGPRWIFFDNSLGAITIPPGTYDMKDVRWVGDVDLAPIGFFTTVTIPEGVTFTNFRWIEGWISVEFTGSTPPVQDMTASELFQLRNGPILRCSGTGPFFRVSGPFPNSFIGIVMFAARLENDGNPVLDLAANGTSSLIVTDRRSRIDSNTMSGVAGTSININTYGNDYVSWSHLSFAGTLNHRHPSPQTKSESVPAASFALSGGVHKATVTFSWWPFATDDYAVNLSVVTTNDAVFSPVVESKTSSGFTINLGTNDKTDLVSVDWSTPGRFSAANDI